MNIEHQKKSSDKILQEIYREIIDYLDLINRRFARIQIIEERLGIIEDHLHAINNRIRRIENFIREYANINEEINRKPVYLEDKKIKEIYEKPKITEKTERAEGEDIIDKINTLTETEKQIIKIIAKDPDIKGGTALAKRIGKTREHVSRLLKKLANEGILIRDEKTWPYKYIVSEKVKQYILLEDNVM